MFAAPESELRINRSNTRNCCEIEADAQARAEERQSSLACELAELAADGGFGGEQVWGALPPLPGSSAWPRGRPCTKREVVPAGCHQYQAGSIAGGGAPRGVEIGNHR